MDIKTKYIEIPEIANEYNKKIRKDEFEFTEKGLNILKDLQNDNLTITEYEPTIKEPYPNLNKFDLLANIKNNIIKSYQDGLKRITSIYINDERKKLITNEIIQQINDINKCNSVKRILKLTLNDNDLNKCKLMDIFELIKFKPLNACDFDIGIYPIYGATIENKAVKFINKYNIDTNGEEYLQLNKDGIAIGYYYIRNGKFSAIASIYLLKIKEEYKNKINLHKNIEILNIQISNMGFNYGTKLNIERLNKIKVYLNFEQENKNE